MCAPHIGVNRNFHTNPPTQNTGQSTYDERNDSSQIHLQQ